MDVAAIDLVAVQIALRARLHIEEHPSLDAENV